MNDGEVWTLIKAMREQLPGGPTGEGWNASEMTTALHDSGKLPEGWTVIDVADLMIKMLGKPG